MKIKDWIEAERNRVKNHDWDNVMLFTGVEGAGKSTWMRQVMQALNPGTAHLLEQARTAAREVTAEVKRHLDNNWILPHDLVQQHQAAAEGLRAAVKRHMEAPKEGFNVDRIHFRLDDFLGQAPKLPRYSAIVWDEARLNKRRAMHGSTIDTLDFLQDCRGLNLHIGLCFPHEELLDAAVKNHRVRWRWHVSQRGVVELKRRVKRTLGSRRGKFDVFDWQTVAGFYFKDDEGTELRVAYNAKKEAHMRRKEVNEELDLEALGVDVGKLEAAVEALAR